MLVVGMIAVLFIKIRKNVITSFVKNENDTPRSSYNDGDKVIEGEYKIIDDAHKD